MADPLPPASEPTLTIIEPPPLPPTRRAGIVCEFCECTLTPAGEVLKRGEAARKFSRLDEKLETALADAARAQTDLDRVSGELRDLRAATARKPLMPDLF